MLPPQIHSPPLRVNRRRGKIACPGTRRPPARGNGRQRTDTPAEQGRVAPAGRFGHRSGTGLLLRGSRAAKSARHCCVGRLAQRESIGLTSRGSPVRSRHRPLLLSRRAGSPFRPPACATFTSLSGSVPVAVPVRSLAGRARRCTASSLWRRFPRLASYLLVAPRSAFCHLAGRPGRGAAEAVPTRIWCGASVKRAGRALRLPPAPSDDDRDPLGRLRPRSGLRSGPECGAGRCA